jgi:porphobilinogen deaminase
MGGGCHLAVAAYAQLIGQEIVTRGVSFLDGRPRRAETRGGVDAARQLGESLAQLLAS